MQEISEEYESFVWKGYDPNNKDYSVECNSFNDLLDGIMIIIRF